MHITSLNIGLPQEYEWHGRQVRTSIFKQPVAGPVLVYAEHLAGDGQADLRVHGGPNKAVYAYPQEHYAYWKDYLPAARLVPGAFGENLTTVGLLESEVCIGSLYQIGTAVLMAFQPRQPCFKLGIRLQDDGMVRQFELARRSGIYFRVEQEGIVQVGDAISLLQASPYAVTIQDIVDNNASGPKDLDKIQEILAMPYLSASWRERFTRMVAEGSN
ncbi:MOSC domain-containing protein [Hymenobacter sp.]|jgi:MOSC domain-containing protein YiiM|uniref:MOSC domain-containing protein n=1 Tax=Hymenobacter sp. TaxID=1898978 RepID=UPI002ED8E882